MTEQLAHYPQQSPFPPVPSDEIDLRLLARALWRGRWWIVGITLLGILLGAGLSLWSTQYQSRGLFLTPDVSVGDYKTYSAALNNLPRWQRFVELAGKQDSEVAELVGKIIASPDPSDFGQMVSPVFTFTDNEAKQFGVKLDESNVGLVGINLTLKEKDQAKESPINLLAEYVRSTVIRVDLQETLQGACNTNRTAELTLNNQKLSNDFDIQQNQQRRDTLTGILSRLPASAKMDSQLVLSMQTGNAQAGNGSASAGMGNERFLSPITQLVGVDVAITDKKLENGQHDRELAAAMLKAEYYCKARDALDKPVTGQSFLAGLADLQQAVFAGKDMNQDIVRQTANELKVQRDNWSNRYLSQMHFVVPPEGAEVRVRKPRLLIGLVLGAILGGLFGSLWALFGSWWRENREVIVAKG